MYAQNLKDVIKIYQIVIYFAATGACDSAPCLNGGTCYQAATKCDQYTCSCPDCFSGNLCQIRKSEAEFLLESQTFFNHFKKIFLRSSID